MTHEQQSQEVAALIGSALENAKLPPEDCLDVLLFIVGDVVAQSTGYMYDPELAGELQLWADEAYQYHCGMLDDKPQNATLN